MRTLAYIQQLLATVAATSLLACQSSLCDTWPDGSPKCDGAPVMASDLNGEWSRADGLTFATDGDTYVWFGPECEETGHLSGGLEFTPTLGQSAVCFGSELYSASVHWTDVGLQFEIDGVADAVRLTWQDK